MPLEEWSESTLIAQLGDEPAFSEELESLFRTIDKSGPKTPDVIVNLQGVRTLNSSNLTQLLRLRKLLHHAGRRLRICSCSDQVWSVFIVTGLDKLFEFTDDVTTSLTSLQIDGD